MSIRALPFRGGPFLFGVKGRPVRKYRIKLYFWPLWWGGGFGIIGVERFTSNFTRARGSVPILCKGERKRCAGIDMLEFPICVRNVLRWSDGDRSFLFNPQNGIFLSTTDLFNDLLTVCGQMDRTQLVAHLSAKYPLEEIHSLFAKLDQIANQLSLFETSVGRGLFRFTEEMVEEGLVDTLTLTLTHDCNLRCDYCFGVLEYMQDTASMSVETARVAIDYLFLEASGKERCQIIYTGGEPLLNWPVLESATQYAETKARQCSKEVAFSIKTNGILVSDRVLDFLEQHDFMVQISIDGQQADHDQARHDSDGVGSFEAALDALQRIMQRCNGHRLQIRATVTHQNVKHFKENLLFLTGLGAGNVSAGPVMAPEQSPYRLTREDLSHRRQALLDVVAKLACNPHSPENQRLLKALGYDGLATGLPSSEGRYGCGAGLWHLSVDVDGSIFPCYRLAGHGQYDMGNVWEVNLSHIREVQKRVVPIYNRDHNTRCRRCWGQVICRRGCVASELLGTETEYERCDDTVYVLRALLQAAAKDPAVRRSLPCL